MSNEWDFDGGEGLQNPAWCAEQRRLIQSAMSRGWIHPMSERRPGPENVSNQIMDTKKSAVRPETGKTAV
jgi:hypothetical protein